MKYYYPTNMEAAPLFGLWTGRDLFIIAVVAVFSLFSAVWLHFMLPLLADVVYLILSMQVGDESAYQYITKLGRYFVAQQVFFWEEKND